MATNRVFATGDQLAVACTHPTEPNSGDPVLYGQLPGVALIDERSDGLTTVQFNGVFNLSVKGVNGSGNSAVAQGDKLYYVSADTPVLSKKDTGVFFGIAMGTVSSGGTSTIPVRVGY